MFRPVLSCLTLAVAGATLAHAQKPEAKPEMTANTSVFDVATGDFVATGDARIIYDDIILTADEIRLNQRTNVARAKGNVVVTGRNLRLVGNEGAFNLKERRVEMGDIRAGSPPWLASAERVEGTLDALTLIKPRLYAGEPSRTGPSLSADAGFIADQSKIKLTNPGIGFGSFSMVPLPDVNRDLVDPGLRGKLRVGYKGDLGAYLRPEFTVPMTNSSRFVGGLELFSGRGVMVAPGADYAGTSSTGTYSGSVRSAWIHDLGGSSRRGVDVFNRAIDQDRGLGLWQHRQEWGQRTTLTTNLSWWSDSEVTRDFRWETYKSLPQPDSWAEINHQIGKSGLFSVFVRTRADDFQPVTQRLPELRFDLLPNRLGESGIVQKGFLSGAYLRRTYNAPEFFTFFGESMTADSARLDGYYGLERTFKLSDWASLTPVAGGRYTLDHAVDDDFGLPKDTYQRGIGVVGADLRLLAHGTFDVKKPVWRIDGLRHIVEPLVTYRYYGGANSLPLRPVFPSVEPLPLGLFEQELELDRMRDTDVISNGHVVRAGVRNSLQTRGEGGGSRELATLYIGQEYQPSGADTYLPWNTLFTELRLLPASFLELRWNSRYDHDQGAFVMSNPAIILKDGRRWRLALSNHYLSGLYNDYILGGEWNVSEAWAAGFRLRYDERGDRWREQTYFLRQVLDNTWRVEYRITRSQGDLREDAFSFGVSVDLLSF